MLPRFNLFCQSLIQKSVKRNIGLTAVVYQKVDPIQKLFIDKIHDYAAKSKAAGNNLVDASQDTVKQLNDGLEKLAKQFGSKEADFTKFPVFNFTDPNLEPVGIQIDISKSLAASQSDDLDKTEEEDKPWFDL